MLQPALAAGRYRERRVTIDCDLVIASPRHNHCLVAWQLHLDGVNETDLAMLSRVQAFPQDPPPLHIAILYSQPPRQMLAQQLLGFIQSQSDIGNFDRHVAMIANNGFRVRGAAGPGRNPMAVFSGQNDPQWKMTISKPTVAIIGASTDRRKFGNKAVRAFATRGYEVFPINPSAAEVEGFKAYKSILDVPAEKLDRVSLYLAPALGVKVLDEIVQKPVGELWVNPGAESDELLEKAERLGINTISACSIVGVGMSPTELD